MEDAQNVSEQLCEQTYLHEIILENSKLRNKYSLDRRNTWPRRSRSLCVDDKQNASISKSIIDLERSQGVTCNILNDIKNNAIKSYVNNRNEHCDIVHSTEAVKHTANSNSKSDYTNLSCSFVSMQKPNYYTDYHKEDASDYDRYSLTTVPDNSSGFSEDSFFTDEIINNLIHDWEISTDGANGNPVKKRLNSCDSGSTISDSTNNARKNSHPGDGSNLQHVNNTNLILLNRPSNLPPKPLNEQMKHQKEYEKMIKLLKERDNIKQKQIQKQLNQKLMKEKIISEDVTIWLNEILPHWEIMKKTKKTNKLWWKGLPSCVRGKVWCLSIGNKLNITYDQYKFYVEKSKQTSLKMNPKSGIEFKPDERDSGVDLIRLDINRTFPHLCIFQQGGPYYEMLHRLLAAYVCLRPDIGYVQGMSFIAAVLLLNMNEIEAFICFANILCWPCHKAFYTLDIPKMRCYYATYSDLLRMHIPRIWDHFYISCLTPDMYLVDWIYTVFSKSMNLDLACHIWDLFIRDGDEFIFRAALGILNALKDTLLQMDFLHAAQYLTKIPDHIRPDVLFKSIAEIRIDVGQYTFQEILAFHEKLET